MLYIVCDSNGIAYENIFSVTGVSQVCGNPVRLKSIDINF